MTRIEIFRKNGQIVRYKASGHAGFAEHGEDIVCAALSMAMQLPLGGLQDVLEIYPKFEINDDGFLEVDLEGMNLQGKEKEVNTLLESMVLMLKSLANQYSNFVKFDEKED